MRESIARQLRLAAEAEILRHASVIDIESLYSQAKGAFEALSVLLGEHAFFFEAERPGLFDASVFAYTHLLLEKRMGWRVTRLVEDLETYGNLVQHRERIFEEYYGRRSI